MFDDHHVILHNENIKVDSLEPGELLTAADSFMGRSRQLSMLSFALNHYVFGDSVFAYKTVSLGFHLLVGVLLFLLTRSLVAVPGARGFGPAVALFEWLPGIVAFIWLISPINLTSVLYVSQRMTILAGLFMIAGALIYTRARAVSLVTGNFSRVSVLLLILCLAAAYLAKQNGILLVALVVAIEFSLFRFQGRDGRVATRLLLGLTALVVASVAALLLSGLVDLSRILEAYEVREFTLHERLLTQARVLIFYTGLVLFPAVGRFGLWHDDIPTSVSLFEPPDTVLAIFVLVLLFSIAVAVRKRYPLASLGILWFFAGHAIESTFIPLEMIHEHRNYVPSYGVILALTAFLAHLSRVRASLKVTLLALLAVASSFNLYLRANDWSSVLRHAVAEYLNHPQSARANFHMANINFLLVSRGFEEARQSAYDLFARASELGPYSILPDIGMVVSQAQLEGSYEVEWIERAARKLSLSGGLPSDVAAFKGIRRCAGDGRCEFLVKDLEPLYERAAASSNYKMVIEAAIFYNTGLGNNERALELLERAVRMAPTQPVPRLNYIEALSVMGQREKARELLASMEEDGVRGLHAEREWIEKLTAKLFESG